MHSATTFMRQILLTSLFALLPSHAIAVQLITDEEAQLPVAAKLIARGGLTRGPGIKQISPVDNKVKMPFDIKLLFEPHGGAKIDPASVKMTYLKAPLVDLTERIKPYISASGIDIAKVEVPPGEHHLKVQVTDSKGRVGSTVVSFVVMK